MILDDMFLWDSAILKPDTSVTIHHKDGVISGAWGGDDKSILRFVLKNKTAEAISTEYSSRTNSVEIWIGGDGA